MALIFGETHTQILELYVYWGITRSGGYLLLREKFKNASFPFFQCVLCICVGTMCASVYAHVCVCWVNVGKHSRSPFCFIHWGSWGSRPQSSACALSTLTDKPSSWPSTLDMVGQRKTLFISCSLTSAPHQASGTLANEELAETIKMLSVLSSAHKPPFDDSLCGSFQNFTLLRLIQIIAASFVGVRLMHMGHRI